MISKSFTEHLRDVASTAFNYGANACLGGACSPEAAIIYGTTNCVMDKIGRCSDNHLFRKIAAVATGVYTTRALGYNMNLENVAVLFIRQTLIKFALDTLEKDYEIRFKNRWNSEFSTETPEQSRLSQIPDVVRRYIGKGTLFVEKNILSALRA